MYSQYFFFPMNLSQGSRIFTFYAQKSLNFTMNRKDTFF